MHHSKSKVKVKLSEMVTELKRELYMRDQVYPDLIRKARMSRKDANTQYIRLKAAMEFIHAQDVKNKGEQTNLFNLKSDTMPNFSPEQLTNLVTTFNHAYKVGDKIEVYKTIGGSTFHDTIKREASIIGNHTAVTWLEKHGSYNLTFVKGLSIY